MRRKGIDWLRLFGIFLLFPFHAARVFDFREANYIENGISFAPGIAFMNVIWPWFMPLLFLLAGISAYYSLKKRSAAAFARERVMRLFVPLVLGILFIVPIQGYVARLQEGTLHGGGGYLNYLFTQFFGDFSDLSGYHGTFTPAHLWFILFLFVISLALLPLFSAVLRRRSASGIGRFGKRFGSGVFLLLLFPFLALSEALPDIGGKNPFFYAMFVVIGFFIASNEAAWEAIDRLKRVSLGMFVVLIPFYLWLIVRLGGYDDFAWQGIVLALVRNLYGWATLLTMLGYAQKVLNRGGKTLDYLSGAAFPMYILHQSVMMVVAYFVVQWPISVPAKFAVIAVATLIASVGLYELCRHVAPLRILLGIKRAKNSTEKPALSA